MWKVRFEYAWTTSVVSLWASSFKLRRSVNEIEFFFRNVTSRRSLRRSIQTLLRYVNHELKWRKSFTKTLCALKPRLPLLLHPYFSARPHRCLTLNSVMFCICPWSSHVEHSLCLSSLKHLKGFVSAINTAHTWARALGSCLSWWRLQELVRLQYGLVNDKRPEADWEGQCFIVLAWGCSFHVVILSGQCWCTRHMMTVLPSSQIRWLAFTPIVLSCEWKMDHQLCWNALVFWRRLQQQPYFLLSADTLFTTLTVCENLGVEQEKFTV